MRKASFKIVMFILVLLSMSFIFHGCEKEWDNEDFIEISLDSENPYYHFEKGIFSKDNMPQDIDWMGITYKTWCTETPTLCGRMEPTDKFSFKEMTEPPKGDYVSICANAIKINNVVVFRLKNGNYALVKISEDVYGKNSDGLCEHKFKLQINYPAFPNYVDTISSKIIETGTFIDARDSHNYKTVKIGNQVWMAENLAYLPVISSPLVISDTEKHYYVYGYEGLSDSVNESFENNEKYGVLYNWPAAMAACPKGWHLPTDKEWGELEEYISNDNGGLVKEYNSWLDISKYLKSESGWSAGFGGSDKYGFSALPGGQVNSLGYYLSLGGEGNWWSATFNDEYKSGVTRQILEANTLLILEKSFKEGYSVRCVRD